MNRIIACSTVKSRKNNKRSDRTDPRMCPRMANAAPAWGESKGVYMHTSPCQCAYKSCIQAPCCRQNPKQNHDLSTGWGQHNSLIPPASTRLRKKTKNSPGMQAPCCRQIPEKKHDLATGCSENPNSTGFEYLG